MNFRCPIADASRVDLAAKESQSLEGPRAS